jgi:Co/Zn/Cd efflux system component
MTPRFNVTSVDLLTPVAFITLFVFALLFRYSAMLADASHLLKTALGALGTVIAQVNQKIEMRVQPIVLWLP